MGKGEQDHPERGHRRGFFHRLSGWLPDVVVVVALVLAFAQVQFDVAGRVGLIADPATEPAAVAPPAGVAIADQPRADAVAAAAQADPDPALVRRAIGSLLQSKDLGRTTALVEDEAGQVLFQSGTMAITPASNTKLLTSLAALEKVGPETRFRTSVKQVAGQAAITLVGGGDPYLASTPAKARGDYPPRATSLKLARQAAAVLRAAGQTRVSLGYDDSLFSGPAVSPHWPRSYVTESIVPPISSLWIDQAHDPDGYGYVPDPASAAATVFARQLRAAGVTVSGPVRQEVASPDAADIAHVDSAPLADIVERLVTASDNNATEVVLRHLGRAVSGEASFVGGAKAVLQVAGALGVEVKGAVVHDGSGLSRDNRLTARTLVDVLRVAASPDHPRLRAVVTGLSVAGFNGSLTHRFDKTATSARGRVWGKTGTLTGVHGLAGVATDLTGAPMFFAVMTDKVPVAKTLAAREQLARFAAALGSCRCALPVGSTP